MPAPKRTRREERPKDGLLARTRRRVCYYCSEKIDDVDYKAGTALRRFVSDKGKIRSRRVTGACRRHQRQVAVAVKRARQMALLPYADR